MAQAYEILVQRETNVKMKLQNNFDEQSKTRDEYVIKIKIA